MHTIKGVKSNYTYTITYNNLQSKLCNNRKMNELNICKKKELILLFNDG